MNDIKVVWCKFYNSRGINYWLLNCKTESNILYFLSTSNFKFL